MASPDSLKSKKILVGITGSIAAYKSAFLVRLLVKAGAEVQVILTEPARDFVTPLTLATLSHRPVASAFLSDEEKGVWHNHVALGEWADALVIAPATANTLAKCAGGFCDNLLTAVYLSARCPVFFAPAMDLDMFAHGSTQANLDRLRALGNHVLPVGHGELASGLTGEGRMAEPEFIAAHLADYFAARSAASGKRVLITAGPTREAIDPVRYISNHSSGKMGYALAAAFRAAGASVTLISGPVAIPVPEGVERVDVVSSADMYEAASRYFPQCDLAIFAAAVADYTPAQISPQKIKKKETTFDLELVKTKDIAASLGKLKAPHQLIVGFALETENEMRNAIRKLHEKHLDFIVLNSLNDTGAGFAHDTNKITVIDKSEQVRSFELKAKSELAKDIADIILQQWRKQ